MDRVRRNERMSVMMKILAANPNRLMTLNSFCVLFGSAKSTVSEDIDALRRVVKEFDLGEIETVTGASGGVLYRPTVSRASTLDYIQGLCGRLFSYTTLFRSAWASCLPPSFMTRGWTLC